MIVIGRSLARTLLLVALAGLHADVAAGQSDPGRAGAASAIAGATVGLYSGGVLAVAGSLLPCNRTLLGPKCVAVSGIVGASVGVLAGRVIGADNTDAVRDRVRGGLYGVVIGGAVGAVLQQAVRQYSWTDAVTVGVFGGAIGTAPRGALIGTGVGAALGGVLWLGHGQDGLPNLILLTVVGAAVGGLYDWVDGALDSDRAGSPGFGASLSIPIG